MLLPSDDAMVQHALQSTEIASVALDPCVSEPGPVTEPLIARAATVAVTREPLRQPLLA